MVLESSLAYFTRFAGGGFSAMTMAVLRAVQYVSM